MPSCAVRTRDPDPEFSGDSSVGTPGLVDAIRSGNLAVANALGSELAESPALMALLPGIAVFSGEVASGMTRGHGWGLPDIGLRLERAVQVLHLLRLGLSRVAADERSRIELLLEAANVTITYRSRYLTSLQADLTIDLLLIDDSNRRSVAFQLDRLRRHVADLPRHPDGGRRSQATRLATSALAEIELADLERLASVRYGARPDLEQLIERVIVSLGDLSENRPVDYLSYTQSSRRPGS